ncbi:leucyl/phenylalanyl-tRNA--protein transferase [Roseospirillum parvum]|uniref:Leucyl/phenylalanyl-tRNA--protein transferase n=1 Tax=Roseospirillum parvum TaxID=83401 RepID=A0A1G7UKG2_9PROT|nr:leucyl/phenylalanyl-tRNA--protein transferase [Roseospirillum parvum]SDG48052.1 leucyl/phenylalanyl-tRNA--protein transferase [Roseospirillum parvum]
MSELTPELVVRAYTIGVFPMAKARHDPDVYWVDPEERGILPLDTFHVPRSLAKVLRRQPFRVTVNRAFEQTIAGCAEATEDRPETWINPEIERLFVQLHRLGLAHSVETWQGERLVGGIYGLALAGAFFGESMFSRVPEASKVALVHLVKRLTFGGFTLFDTQFTNPHLLRFGAVDIPRLDYHQRLRQALETPADFHALPED